ncbi:bZIP transcription factor 11-like [Malania oleifera]|uniref:bZIP transcription factor 11-like n=1 Tax=Malania oleifera TaxID=397392 RepID=UPI0025AEBF9B|nr:bZIP transcription factor 11-like [Malania oleifera]
MGSSSGTSSGSLSLLQNSGSEEDLQMLMDQRKRKRMMSNRESARRSRMRKQKHLDDLTAQVSQLRKENGQIISSMNITTQHYLTIEAENSVLRAQMEELTRRLESLDELVAFLNVSSGGGGGGGSGGCVGLDQDPNCAINESFLMNPWSSMCLNQPIMASAADMFPY